MSSVSDLLRSADIPVEEAQLLLAWLLGKNRTWLYAWGDKPVNDDHASRFRKLAAQRAEGTPMAYLTGQREFWSLPLKVTPDTLIPRPETEHLVEQALAAADPHADVRVLDMGTGSGAIALALASERPDWTITACDASQAALNIAKENARQLQLNVAFILSNWFDAIDSRFDLIVSNPPYIPDADPHLNQGDLRFEPRSALTAGMDGLDDIRLITAQAPAYLSADGRLLFEHGFDQAPAVQALLSAAGYREVHSIRDLAGHERVTQGISPT